jgi:hypothetical protein
MRRVVSAPWGAAAMPRARDAWNFGFRRAMRLGYNPGMRRTRVRHHTSDENLDLIRSEGAIRASRGWGSPPGVHVELPPFGTTRPFRPGTSSPKADFGIQQDGAFVEFDLPEDLSIVRYRSGGRNAAVLLGDGPLSLRQLHARFVKVRRRFWEFWRTKAE